MAEPVTNFVRVEFGCYTDEDIRRLSVLEVTNQKTFDEMGHATVNGLYDRRLGPHEKMENCGTCSLSDLKCPGHIGHIELPVPVYHPLWMRQLELIVRGSCFSCKRILESSLVSEHLLCLIRLIDGGLWDKIDGLQEIYCQADTIAAAKITSKMVEYVEKTIAENNGEALKTAKASRFLNQARSDLLSEYMSTAFKAKKGHCNHCFVPLRKLRQEHHVRMFFDEGASTRGIEKAKKALITKKKAAQQAEKRKIKKLKQKKKVAGAGGASGDEGSDPDEGYEGDEDGGVLESDGEDDKMDLSAKPEKWEIDEAELENKMQDMQQRALLTPAVLRDHLRQLWDNNSHVLKAICGMLQVPLKDEEKCNDEDPYKDPEARPTDVFFLSVIPVPPTKFRPVARRNGALFENPTNIVYCQILEAADLIKANVTSLKANNLDPDAIVDKTGRSCKEIAYDNLHRAMTGVQLAVNNILDRDLSKIDSSNRPAGVRQLIEKKQGLFRKHMMGKRVDFAARSVISPDPFIAVDEIGIPDVFALKLSFPEPVNAHNVERLRRAVKNGPNEHPGALAVINEMGKIQLLDADDKTQREALARTLFTGETSFASLNAKPKTVLRHIRNGDMLLMNRQPTLHRPSIQAHKAHVLPGEKTIRLHYANCNAYNADFDGDEMNAHFPQSFVGQSEAREIVSTHNQYLVPKNGAPLAGLIQDHVIGGVTLCMRGRFFTKKEYQQLVFSGLVDQQTRVQLLPPCIIKPYPLWSGKQVISTVLRNLLPVNEDDLYINLTGTSKITAKSWINSEVRMESVPQMGEETVVFRQGHLVQGVLDKNHYGASLNGLVHSCYELYGGRVSSSLLTSLGRLFTTFLKGRGFTIGVKDIMCVAPADKKRHEVMRDGSELGTAAVAHALNVDDNETEPTTEEITECYAAAKFDTDDTKLKEIDLSMKQISDQIQNDITKEIMPRGLLRKFPDNNLQLMVVAGAKGSSVNCMQISCLLGQIELEGRRPPITLSGRSLPSFRPYDTSPRAGGFVDGRFLSGIRPQEYFFHCMAGREGLVDTAVKTSRSGYLQRCLIKHLEGIMIEYDTSVRDSDGSIVQFQYGEDNLSVLKTNLLNRKQFPFLIANQKTAAGQREVSRLREILDKKKAKRWDKKIAEYKERWAEFSTTERRSAYLRYSDSQSDSIKCATQAVDEKLGRPPVAMSIEQSFRAATETELEEYTMYNERCPEPTMNRYPPTKYLHSQSERLRAEVNDYINDNPDNLLVKDDGDDVPYGKISESQFDELMSLYTIRSRVEPGDAVGILAAQSIGEPSTQMTLNTFHFAGRGEMNVTLGIPRLREILMVASKTQKTPSMDIPFKQTKHAKKRSKNLQLKLNAVKLADVLSKAEVTANFKTSGAASEMGKVYKVLLTFLPPDQYMGKCLLTPKYILKHVERSFVPDVARVFAKAMKLNSDIKLLNALAAEREPAAGNDDDDDEGEEGMTGGGQAVDEGEDDLDLMTREAGDDADAVAAEDMRRKDEELEYDGEEDEMAEILGDEVAGSEPEDGESVGSDEDESEGSSDEEYKIDKLDSTSAKKRLKQSRSSNQQSSHEMNVDRIATVRKVPSVQKYEYDVENELWCEITFKYPLSSSDIDMTPIVQSAARASLVCDPEKLIKGVSKAILSEPKKESDPLRLRTDGVNIQRMFQYESILDLNNLYTNDIHAMADNYGIEAACRVLIKEIRDVFAAYGITVNYRHLSLIADYMTFDGQYKAFNRTGLLPHASSLQKMTYEASTMFLKNTMLAGAVDDLESPSARIVVGKTVKVGTGAFRCINTAAEE